MVVYGNEDDASVEPQKVTEVDLVSLVLLHATTKVAKNVMKVITTDIVKIAVEITYEQDYPLKEIS